MSEEDPWFTALSVVLERYDSFNKLGALWGEGGERAFRGWLVSGFLEEALGWPWRNVVLGESFDVLTLDWRDHPVVYVETKTPDSPVRTEHRGEALGRISRWGSLHHVFLSNGRHWERFAVSSGELEALYRFEDGPDPCQEFFGPLDARRYLG